MFKKEEVESSFFPLKGIRRRVFFLRQHYTNEGQRLEREREAFP